MMAIFIVRLVDKIQIDIYHLIIEATHRIRRSNGSKIQSLLSLLWLSNKLLSHECACGNISALVRLKVQKIRAFSEV
jgi:hypothetical protein